MDKITMAKIEGTEAAVNVARKLFCDNFVKRGRNRS